MSPPRDYTVLENNPEVLTFLAHKLGLSPKLQFHEIYTLSDQTLLTHIPRPVYALLAILPLTPTWSQTRTEEDSQMAVQYPRRGADEEVLWFRQKMHEGCGTIGLMHCVGASGARAHVVADSVLDKLLNQAVNLDVGQREELLNASEELFQAHQLAASMGDTADPGPGLEGGKTCKGQHFVAFVKGGKDGRLWELEGVRRGPVERGLLSEDEDALSPRAVELGIGRVIEMERTRGGGDLRFSCIALAPAVNADDVEADG